MSPCDHNNLASGRTVLNYEDHTLRYIMSCPACGQEWLFAVGDPYYPAFREDRYPPE